MTDLDKVKQNGLALIYVKNQTHELCLEAVKQNGYALKYVKDKTTEICLEAIKQDERALQFCSEEFKKWYNRKNKLTKLKNELR
jgi:hypothetical protein